MTYLSVIYSDYIILVSCLFQYFMSVQCNFFIVYLKKVFSKISPYFHLSLFIFIPPPPPFITFFISLIFPLYLALSPSTYFYCNICLFSLFFVLFCSFSLTCIMLLFTISSLSLSLSPSHFYI